MLVFRAKPFRIVFRIIRIYWRYGPFSALHWSLRWWRRYERLTRCWYKRTQYLANSLCHVNVPFHVFPHPFLWSVSGHGHNFGLRYPPYVKLCCARLFTAAISIIPLQSFCLRNKRHKSCWFIYSNYLCTVAYCLDGGSR